MNQGAELGPQSTIRQRAAKPPSPEIMFIYHARAKRQSWFESPAILKAHM